MRWVKADEDDEMSRPVVRALSFCSKTEDGSIVAAPVTNKTTALRAAPSFTSIDVKKSRRIRPTMQPTKPSVPTGTQSLGRPVRVNKLVLRVPSAASEYEHKRVIHSVCVPTEGGGAQPLKTAPPVGVQLAGVPAISCDADASSLLAARALSDSTTHLLPNTPKAKLKYRHRNLTPGQVVSTIASSGDYDKPSSESDKWKAIITGQGVVLTGGYSDVGSASLSNFSSGDGLSTPTQMGSTTRLIHAHKSNGKWRCTWPEYVSTVLSILSLAGTLGNILRLPRMVYFHGGGIFLLVYILVTLIFGIPLTFLEIGLGQFCQHGTVKVWRAVNLFRGVGYAKVFISLVASVYYSIQVATSLSLLTWTVKGPLPFSECNFLNENGTRPLRASGEQCLKATFLAPILDDALGFGITLIFLVLLWTLVLICVMKRSATYRRAMYFLFPVCVGLMVALLVEASSRTTTGITDLFHFEWTTLADVQVWYFAMVQMFFSLHIGFGNINTCAGRIYPKSNAFWTAITLVLSNLLMGIAAVVLVYLWVGQIKDAGLHLPDLDVPELFLLTVIYNVGVSSMAELSVLWSALAYLLVFIAGLASLIVFIYTVLVAVAVETKRKWHWWHINVIACFSCCILAILGTIPTYQAIPHVLDHYVIGHGVVFLTILELIGFAMIYGCSNLYNDLEFVIGNKLSSAWRSLWIVTPFVLFIIEVCSANLLPLTGETAGKSDQLWEYSLGWALYFCCWLIVLVCAIVQICLQVDYNLAQKFISAAKPSRNWGPVDPIYRHCWVQWRNRYNLTGTKDFTLKRRGTRDYTHHARTAPPDSVSNSFDMGGVNPGGDWGYKRASSTPVKLDYGPENIIWRKNEATPTRH